MSEMSEIPQHCHKKNKMREKNRNKRWSVSQRKNKKKEMRRKKTTKMMKKRRRRMSGICSSPPSP